MIRLYRLKRLLSILEWYNKMLSITKWISLAKLLGCYSVKLREEVDATSELLDNLSRYLTDTHERIKRLADQTEASAEDIDAQNAHIATMTSMLFRRNKGLVSLAASECSEKLKKILKKFKGFDHQYLNDINETLSQNLEGLDLDSFKKEKVLIKKFLKRANKFQAEIKRNSFQIEEKMESI